MKRLSVISPLYLLLKFNSGLARNSSCVSSLSHMIYAHTHEWTHLFFLLSNSSQALPLNTASSVVEKPEVETAEASGCHA